MKTIRDFRPLSDRYSFDLGPCSYANGEPSIISDPRSVVLSGTVIGTGIKRREDYVHPQSGE